MAIDVEREKLLSLTQAANSVPGGKVDPGTCWRWALTGYRGLKLETIVVGRRRYTSREALLRFIAATTQVANLRLESPSNDAPTHVRPLRQAGASAPETAALHNAIGLRRPRRRGA